MESILDLSELERELCRIPEVTAARVVAGSTGIIEEVHILSLPLKHAKQVVRDVQSVAMASFGVDLDRRIVSVVQLDAPVPAPPPPPPPLRTPAPEPEAEPEPEPAEPELDLDLGYVETPEPVHLAASNGGTEPQAAVATAVAVATDDDIDIAADTDVTRINVDTVSAVRSGHQCTAEVVLSRGKQHATGAAEGIVATSSVLRLVAHATISALRLLEPAATRADVEAAMVVHLGARQVALTTVVLVVPPYEEVCAGSAVVRTAGELDAVARAVLDATNRRLPQLR